MSPLPDGWHSLLEVNPPLKQCRVLLFGGADHQSFADCSVHLSNGTLKLNLGSATTATTIQLSLGEGVTEPVLRAYADHVAVQLKLSDAWLTRQNAKAQGPDLADVEVELCCRACRASLLRERSDEGPLQALHLPTDLWQACAEVVACEECMPLGQGHLRAELGRLFVSAQSLLAARGDLSTDLVPSDDGLLYCRCGTVVGEADAPRMAKKRRNKANARNFCGWGHICRSAGVLLYKHRASMPFKGSLDALAEYTEEASVLAHLLTLRVSEGQSRFVVLPSHPSFDAMDASASATEALELRVVLPELLLLQGEEVQLASKVLFRACRCAALPEVTQVVVPQEAFEAVCSRLDSWVQRLPASLSQAPGKDWHSSYLPRPPEA